MSTYDDILKEARTKVEAFRQMTAREYIPRMYLALRDENPHTSPEDARDRIYKDCLGMWEKRTILDALPDEAKDLKKQKAGRLRQKERNSAAAAAAPSSTKNKKQMSNSQVSSFPGVNDDTKKEEILIDTSGRPSSVKELLSKESWGTSDNTENNKSKFASSKPNQGILTTLDNQETLHQTDCQRCKELEDALLKTSSVVSADKLENDDTKYRIP
jgi:hypothetical protein